MGMPDEKKKPKGSFDELVDCLEKTKIKKEDCD